MDYYIPSSGEGEQFEHSVMEIYANFNDVMTIDEMMIFSIILEDLTAEKLQGPVELAEYLVRTLYEDELVKLNLTMIQMQDNGGVVIF